MFMYDAGAFAPLASVMRDLNVHEDKIQAVIQALTTGETDLADNSFAEARIPTAAFGGSPVGHELGAHHNRAQEVFNDTIKGVTQDLTKFRDGVQQAVRLVDTADQSSADDLQRKREVAQSLQNVWQNSEGDRAYDRGRNRYNPSEHRPEPSVGGDY
jgi:hypothetical protein